MTSLLQFRKKWEIIKYMSKAFEFFCNIFRFLKESRKGFKKEQNQMRMLNLCRNYCLRMFLYIVQCFAGSFAVSCVQIFCLMILNFVLTDLVMYGAVWEQL